MLEQQELLRQSILSYFSTPGTANQDANWHLFGQCFVPNLRVISPGTVDDLVQAFRSKTLHRVIIHQKIFACTENLWRWLSYSEDSIFLLDGLNNLKDLLVPTESEMPPSEPFEGFHKTGSEDIPRLVKMIKGKFKFDILLS